jgi:hypothetical protein
MVKEDFQSKGQVGQAKVGVKVRSRVMEKSRSESRSCSGKVQDEGHRSR